MRAFRGKVIVGLLIAVTVAVAVVMALFVRAREKAHAQMVQLFGREQALNVVRDPDQVDAYLLRESGSSDMRSWVGPVLVDEEIAEKIALTLLSHQTYGWGYKKGCFPDEDVQFSFWRGQERVDVLLCFKCAVLLIKHNGTIVGGEDFDAAESVLLRATKDVFPDDSAVQSLRGHPERIGR